MSKQATPIVVSSHASLSHVHVAEQTDGTLAYVVETTEYFELRKDSGATANGASIIEPIAGSPIAGAADARWHLLLVEASGAELQSAFYIDQASGNDDASGDSPSTAIASFDEYRTRVGQTPIGTTQTLTFVGDYTGDILLDQVIGPSGRLILRGTRTPLYSSTFSARVIWDPTTLTEGTVTDAGLPVSWTASGLTGRVLTFDDLPLDVYGRRPWSWVAKDDGAKTARYAPAWDPVSQTNVVPTVNQPFTVHRLTEISGSIFASPIVQAGVGAAVPSVLLLDLHFSGGARDSTLTGRVNFEGCHFFGSVHIEVGPGAVTTTGCRFDGSPQCHHGAAWFFVSSYVDGPLTTWEHGLTQVSGQVLVQGGVVRVHYKGLLRIFADWVATFDNIQGVFVHTGGLIAGREGKLWGRGIVSDCIVIESDGCVTYLAAAPEYQHDPGASEVRVGNINRTFAQVIAGPGYVNATNLARIVLSET